LRLTAAPIPFSVMAHLIPASTGLVVGAQGFLLSLHGGYSAG